MMPVGPRVVAGGLLLLLATRTAMAAAVFGAASGEASGALEARADDLVIVVDVDGVDGVDGSIEPVSDPEPPGPAAAVAIVAAPSVTSLRAELTSRFNVDTRFDPVDEDVVEWWNVGRLRLQYAPGRRLTAVVEARVRWGVVSQEAAFGADFWSGNGARNGKWTGDVELRQGYLAWRSGPMELAAGQRLYVWGKNEVLAPADLLNPHDLRFDPVAALTAPQDAKRPVFAFDAAYWWGETSCRLVVVPFFATHRVFLGGRDFALGAPGSDLRELLRPLGIAHPSAEDAIQEGLVGTRTPEESPWQAWTALRAATTWAGWDMAATVHYGWDRIPRVTIDPGWLTLLRRSGAGFPTVDDIVTDPELSDAVFGLQDRMNRGESVLSATYQRQWAFAAEAEGVLGDFVLRGDLGYTRGQIFYQTDFNAVRRPMWSGAFGAEYMRGESLFVQLTSYGVVVLDPPAERLVLIENTDQPADAARSLATLWGLAATLRWRWVDEAVELSSTAAYNISPGDYVGTVRLSYSGLEPHRVAVGWLFLGGPKGTVGRHFGRNDMAFVEYGAAW